MNFGSTQLQLIAKTMKKSPIDINNQKGDGYFSRSKTRNRNINEYISMDIDYLNNQTNQLKNIILPIRKRNNTSANFGFDYQAGGMQSSNSSSSNLDNCVIFSFPSASGNTWIGTGSF
jgi:hypothetical protein